MKLLHLDSSILGAHSTSRLLTAEVVEAIKLAEPSVSVSYRDLAAADALQVDATVLGARGIATVRKQLVHGKLQEYGGRTFYVRHVLKHDTGVQARSAPHGVARAGRASG